MNRAHLKGTRTGLPTAALLASTVLVAQGCSGAGAAAPASTGAQPDQCTSMACFSEHLGQCQPATFTSAMGRARAQYEIQGTAGDRCQVSLTFKANPNPAWVDTPLTFVLDPAQPAGGQLKEAVAACLAGDAEGFQCDGPLLAVVGAPPAHASADRGAVDRPCGQAVSVSGEPLYPLPRDGKWGYVNRAGDWVIAPQWRQVGRFSEGRAAVDAGSARGGSRWGIIDRHGDYVLEPALPSSGWVTIDGAKFGGSPVKPFSQGCAAATGASATDAPFFVTRNGGFWLRDGLPDALTELDVREFGSFSEGKAWFRVMPEEFADPVTYGWIDTHGAVVIEPTFEGAGDFVEGLAPAASSEDNWGYIDASGSLAWPRKWTVRRAYAFSDGLARARINDDNEFAFTDGETWAITELNFTSPRTVDAGKSGKPIATAPLDKAGSFSSGLAPVLALPFPNRSLFYIDSNGDIVLEPDENFNVCSTWGYRTGTPKSLLRTPEFRHGLARLLVANDGGDCGQISVNGDYATYPKAHYVYIDTEGEVVLAEPFRAGDTDAHPQPGSQ